MRHAHTAPPTPPAFLGVSRCLLGDMVRYDGQHKHVPALLQTLLEAWQQQSESLSLSWWPVCPEIEAGWGAPREPVHLEEAALPHAPPQVWTNHGRRERSASLYAAIDARLAQLEKQALCGFVLKAKSPSCGLQVPLYAHGAGEDPAQIVGQHDGLFAATLQRRWPSLPLATEAQLQSTRTIADFVAQCLNYATRSASPS